jgi:hypothetical protein
MLRFIIRAPAACASIAAIALHSPTASPQTADPDFLPPAAVLIEEDFSDPAAIADRWQVMAGSWSASRGTYGSTVSATSIATLRR